MKEEKAGRGSLTDYRGKRDPARTTEPFAGGPSRRGPTRHGAFVVHQHDARNLHFDLRIEIAGALTSFAVPKGPSLCTRDKRLAVQTENHPLEYTDFEDVIPDGSYGAGAMIVWDRGRVRYLENTAEDGLEAGKIDFELDGQKLGGRFALVRTQEAGTEGEDSKALWLLLKKEDGHSKETGNVLLEQPRSVLSGLTVHELASAGQVSEAIEARAVELGAVLGSVTGPRLSPMLCSSEGVGLDAKGWLYELKIDGVRIVADKRGEEVKLTYRTGRDATSTYPEVARAVRALPLEIAVLDGEVVAFDETGRPNFQRLGRRIGAARPTDVGRLMWTVPVTYLVFDLLAVGDRDLRRLPLSSRKELLSSAVRGKGTIRALDHIEDQGRALFDFCEARGLEGVVAKKADSQYRAGPKRYPDWVKIKCERDDELVVVGFTMGEGNRKRLGALDLAAYEGERLVLRGKVGSGLDDATIDDLLPRLQELAVAEPVAEGTWGREKGGRTYVKPQIVVSVRYQGFSAEGKLRFPVFRGVRDEVAKEDCTVAPPISDDAVTRMQPRPESGRIKTRTVGRRGVRLTNQTKVFWPAEGFTKGDLCDYYERIAGVLLPFLVDRPVMLVRYPDGILGKSFYQWRIPKDAPPFIRAFPIRSEEHDGKNVSTFIVEDVDTLLYIANLGCIPLHVLPRRVSDLETCDYLVIDLDVGKARLRDAVLLARELHDLLDELGLSGYPKTSGQSGLHVLVPLGPGVSFDTARTLTTLLGQLLASRHPDIATCERIKDRRGERVYVDTGQTGPSRTIVAPYSVRAVPGARVSTPLFWDEVSLALDPGRHSIFSVADRVAELGDPMAGLLDERPDIAAAVGALGRLLGRD